MTKKVLIADDQPDARQLLEDILEAFEPRVRVITAVDGEEALKVARAEKPDLAFLDVMMPGKDGFAVCRELKADPDLAKMYVILVTALAQFRDREKGAAAGADEYITKPYDTNFVTERVQAVLGVKPV